MNKKILISLLLTFSLIIVSSISFATFDKIGNDMRNGTENVKNTTQNIARGAGNVVKDGVNSMTGNRNYNTTRVSTDDTTLFGMTTNTWTWLIVGITAIAIIAVIWYYSMQLSKSNNRHSHHDNDRLE